MILPQTYMQALLLMILSTLCWGLWAGLFKVTHKWRFELFYFDFAFGVALAAVIYGFTVGSLGYDGFDVLDDLMHAGKRQWLFAFGGGIIFNLANIILLGAVQVAGMAMAIPIGLGLALIIGVGLNLVIVHSGDTLMVLVGLALILIGILFSGVAYSFWIGAKIDAMVKEGKVKTTANVPGARQGLVITAHAPSSVKALVLTLIAAGLMWALFPLDRKATVGELGMGPYALTVMTALGILISTFIFNLFFINLPVEGEPLEIWTYFSGSWKNHLSGVASGVVWCTGSLAALVSVAGEPPTQLAPSLVFALREASVVVAVLAGIFVWKEFRDATPRVRTLLAATIIALTAGIAVIAVAGHIGAKA